MFDHTHSQIGSLGQIVVKAPPVPKKKVEVERKKKPPKVTYVLAFFVFSLKPSIHMLMSSVPGPGKGNWSKYPILLSHSQILMYSPTVEGRKREESSGEKGIYSHACEWDKQWSRTCQWSCEREWKYEWGKCEWEWTYQRREC